MGALSDAFGYNSPSQAAGSSINYGLTSGGLATAGQLFGGVGAFQQGSYLARVASNNASIMRANASEAVQAGTYEESASNLRYGLLEGKQKVASAANNIDVNSGSALATRQATAQIGAMDAAMIHFNAARQAYGEQTEAASLTAQSKLDQAAAIGGFGKGLFNAGATLLSSASSVGSKFAAYQQNFPQDGS